MPPLAGELADDMVMAPLVLSSPRPDVSTSAPAVASLEAPAAEAERQEAPAAEPERKKVRLAEAEDRGVSLSAFYKQQGGGAHSGGDETGGADGTEDDEVIPKK